MNIHIAERFSSLVGLTHYIEENQVILRCTTSQLPVSSTVWSKDGRRISSSTAYTVHTTLVDVMKSMYISQLAFEWNGNNIEPVIQCDVYAEWVSPGESYYGGVCEWPNSINNNIMLVAIIIIINRNLMFSFASVIVVTKCSKYM